MQGYFISNEQAQELGLINDSNFLQKAQKTVIVITEKDFVEENTNFDFSNANFEQFATHFYEHYFQSIMESFFAENV